MFPTLQTMLDAAASEAVVEPHDVAADGDMASVPRVRTLAEDAHRSATHLCSQVNPELGEEQAMQVDCSTQPTPSGKEDTIPYEILRGWVTLDALKHSPPPRLEEAGQGRLPCIWQESSK